MDGAPRGDDAVDLRYYLGVLRRRAWVVVVSTILVAATAGGLSLLQSKEYEARADLLIRRRASDRFDIVAGGVSTDAKRNIQTEVKILGNRAVRDAATEAIGHEPDVRIDFDEDADVVSVVARSGDPRQAKRDADAYAKAYVDYRLHTTVQTLVDAGQEIQAQIDEIDAQLDDLAPSSTQRAVLESQRAYLVEQRSRLEIAAGLADAGGAAVVAEAEVPESPVSPKPVRNAAVGAVLGLLLGIGLAFVFEYLDDTIKDRDSLERTLGSAVPVLAEIPGAEPPKHVPGERYVVVAADPMSVAAEAYGILRTALLFLAVDQPMRKIQVTSASPSEGKSTIATNLAMSLARAGKRVIVVDLDLRRPRVHQYFGVSNTIGFTTALVGEVEISSTIRRVGTDEMLGIVPSGRIPPNPSELLTSPQAREALAQLEARADYLVVDSPPVLPVADALAVAAMVDATILVARVGESSRRAVHRAVENLGQVGAPLVGVVLNGVEPEASGYGYGRYAYQPRRVDGRRGTNGAGAARGTGIPAAPQPAQERVPPGG